MSIDPMTSYEQAEAEAVERADEARKEQHYAEAEKIAKATIGDYLEEVRHHDSWVLAGAVENILNGLPYHASPVLSHFAADYGISALLRVIARALESSK